MKTELWAAAILLVAATTAFALGRRPPKAASSVEIREWSGQYEGPAQAGYTIADDAKSWTALWAKLGQKEPTMDVRRDVAVAVFAGEKSTGGYSIDFPKSNVKNDDLHVAYRVREPDGMANQSLTRPWKVRLFARPKGRVVVESSAE